MLIVGLVVGVGIGLMQALTQIQEATLVYAPKIVAIFVSLLMFLPLMGALMAASCARSPPASRRCRAGRPAWRATPPPTQVYAAGLIFARVGAMVMLLPGLGDTSVPPRIRLSFALPDGADADPLVVAKRLPVPGRCRGVGGGGDQARC